MGVANTVDLDTLVDHPLVFNAPGGGVPLG